MKIFSKMTAALSLVGLVVLPIQAFAFLPPVIDPSIPVMDLGPKLAVVTAVTAETYDTTPDFTFSSTEAGTIGYIGDCASTATAAVAGNNTVTFNALAVGMHSNCKVTVTSTATGFISKELVVPAFEVKLLLILPPGIDILAPKLSVISGVPTTTEDHTPDFTFKSDEAGTITYGGSCSSTATAAVAGNNTVTFNNLSAGTYSNCTVKVTDAASNVSNVLEVPTFTVIETLLPPAVAICGSFTDVTTADSDCEAILYVKSLGSMTGNPDGTFAPDSLLQRDQIAKIALVTFAKFDATTDYCGGSAAFPDVSESSWAFQYVCRAKLLGVVTGYASGADKGYFRPARSVNRAEFLAFMLRNLSGTMAEGSSYTDVSSGDWFNKYAKFSYDNSLFAGTKLNPTNFTTRREVARVIFKIHTLGKI